MSHSRILAVLLALGLLAGHSALASDLTLDGQSSLQKPIGRHVQIALTGQPNLPTMIVLAAKLTPGEGLVVEGGIPQLPVLGFLPSPSTDATGLALATVPTPNDPALVGLPFYVWGAIFDPANPIGFDIALGANFTFTDGDMISIPRGSLVMGDHLGMGASDELPLHPVVLDAFDMDVYETTNQEFADYLNSALSQGSVEVVGDVVSQAGGGQPLFHLVGPYTIVQIVWTGAEFAVEPGMAEHPVTQVTWYGAGEFANWRSAQDGLVPCYDTSAWTCDFTASGYRLPTEAEWEYAARGGELSPYYAYPWGNTIDGSQANTWDSGDPFENTLLGTTTVGYYDGAQTPAGVDMANGYGLYDMAGNVWEWCYDRYGFNYYNASPVLNPKGPAVGSGRVMRGGSYYFPYSPGNHRCADRQYRTPNDPSEVLGFRLVRRTPE
jgi:formylglycine-generating enzyme required for sulfatase activity